MKILIVEDNPANAQLVMDLLQGWGYTYKDVNTAEAAIESLESEHFDVLLLDMVLPGKPGYELIPKIKKISSEIYIVVMTGQDDPVLERKVRDLGVDDYLHKPFPIKSLQNSLRRLAPQEA